MVDNMEVSSPVGKSDHVVLSWVFRYGNENSGERSRGQTKLNYRKGNYTDMSEALSQVNWDSILLDMDTEQTWNCIKDTIKGLVEEYVPKVKTGKKEKVQNTMVEQGLRERSQEEI